MKNFHILTTSLVAIAAFTQSISAETLLVPEQYPDIQSAVNAVDEDGDVIDVGPGTYDGFNAQSVPHTFQILSRGGPEQTFFRLDNPTQLPLFKLPQGCTIRGFTCENIVFATSNDFPCFITASNSEVQEFVFKNCNNNQVNFENQQALLGSGTYIDCSFSNCLCPTTSLAFSSISNSMDIGQRVTIDGCTFTDCNAYYFAYRPIVQNSVFENCRSSRFIYRPVLRPENCTFRGCNDLDGGTCTVIWIDNETNSQSRDVYNCAFEDNYGQCIRIESSPSSDIVGCEFSGNTNNTYGSGIYISSSNGNHFVSSCIFKKNSGVLPGGAIYSSGAIYLVDTSACGNTPSNFYGPVDASDQSNNISVNCEEEVSCCLPGSCLVLPSSTCADVGGISLTGDCNQEDCPNEGACCIDGDCVFTKLETCFDLGGNYAGFGTECASTICEPTCEGDTSGNGIVDFADLIAVLNNWGPCSG